jgi:N utilization substance protein B
MGKRRRSREFALQALYAYEFGCAPCDQILQYLFDGKNTPLDVKEFCTSLVESVISHIEELDRLISQISENWTIERLALIDKNILRMGMVELLYFQEIPVKVTINEAVEIAKKFSTPDSGRFVNGILDKVVKIKAIQKL